MNKATLFVSAVIALQFGASLFYFYQKNIRLGRYWLFAAGINLCVTI